MMRKREADNEEDDNYFSVEAMENDEIKEYTHSNCDTESTRGEHPDDTDKPDEENP